MSLSENYKRWHKPNQLPNAKTKQGYYKAQHPEKYIGNPTLIIYRSGWEFSFCKWCDFSPSIIRWSSEPIRIPYYDRVSKLEELRRQGLDPNNPKNWIIKYYNTDFWIEVDKGDGITQKMFIEIKPADKLKKPMLLFSYQPLSFNISTISVSSSRISSKMFFLADITFFAPSIVNFLSYKSFFIVNIALRSFFLYNLWPVALFKGFISLNSCSQYLSTCGLRPVMLHTSFIL